VSLRIGATKCRQRGVFFYWYLHPIYSEIANLIYINMRTSVKMYEKLKCLWHEIDLMLLRIQYEHIWKYSRIFNRSGVPAKRCFYLLESQSHDAQYCIYCTSSIGLFYLKSVLSFPLIFSVSDLYLAKKQN